MNDLSEDIDNLKKSYREVFLKTHEEFKQKIEKMTQEEFLRYLKEDAIKEAYRKQLEIIENKKNSPCSCCGACCKLACSEFSFEELKTKSENGDVTAKEFIETFIPYESESEAQKNYPEYFELLKSRAQDEKIYFYHCLKVTKDNRCSDYENRPEICRNFPDNPIEFLPKTCAYSKWKKQNELRALSIHATLEIIGFYKGKMGACG